MTYRTEKDSMGEIDIPVGALYGPATQRSLNNFAIGTYKMPDEILTAIVLIKEAAAKANCALGVLSKEKCDAIVFAAKQILAGGYEEHFPLVVWQTGSGTQTNMNVNEVIAHIAKNAGAQLHPNDDVNKSQSTNDVFPSALHIATLLALTDNLLPSLNNLKETFLKLECENQGIMKTGRTHLMDATPISFAEEISGWRGIVERGIDAILSTVSALEILPIGGTAVGTGANAPIGFDKAVASNLAKRTGLILKADDNKFAGMSSKSALINFHSALKNLAMGLNKIASDIKWLACGPRAGLGEIFIPENEAGSSIMPGKVNPTQCEALSMVCFEVLGNDTTVSICEASGNFELNVYMPLVGFKVIESITLLADAVKSFDKNCLSGVKPNKQKMQSNFENSLMLATYLNPIIGYDNGAKAVKLAASENISLKDALGLLDLMTAEQFDEFFNKLFNNN